MGFSSSRKALCAGSPHTLLKRAAVELFQLLPHSLVQLPQGEGLLIAQGGNNLCLSKMDGALSIALVPGVAHSGGNDGGAIVLCQFLVAAVENDLVASVRNGCDFTVVRKQKSGHSAKIVVGVDAAQQSALYAHILPGF